MSLLEAHYRCVWPGASAASLQGAPPAERLAAVARVLSEEGYMAEGRRRCAPRGH